MNEPGSDLTWELLNRHRAGDKAALEILMHRYYPRVLRLVRLRLGHERLSRAEIDDYVQEVFVRILQSNEQYEERGDARFIDGVAVLVENTIRNQARHDHAQKRGGALAQDVRLHADSSVDLELVDDTTMVPDKAARLEEIERIDGCVAQLSEAHRQVIDLRLYVGFDWQTIAERMGRPSPEACQELFRRAQRELRTKITGA